MERTGESNERAIGVLSRREFLRSAATGAALAVLPGRVLGASAESLRSETRLHKGKPALFVNGRLTSQMTAFVGRPQDLPDLLEAGFTIIDVGVPFGWTGPESYDYTGTDSRMDECLHQSGKILILPRMEVVPGDWWGEQFPNDISRRADGSPAQFKRRWHPSFASPTYRQLALPAIRSFVRHLEEKYGDRVLGYFVCNGVYGEWLSWNAYWEVNPGEPPPKKFGVEDYSAPAQEAFRQWLRKKYADDVTRLEHFK